MVVASPPGAGKTRLVVHLAEQLNRRAQLTVAIATQTRAQVLDVTNRAAAIGTKVALLGTRDSNRPMDLHPQAGYLKGTAQLSRWKGAVIATTARWMWVNERDYTADICIVDFSSRPHGVFHVGPTCGGVCGVRLPSPRTPQLWSPVPQGPLRPAEHSLSPACDGAVANVSSTEALQAVVRRPQGGGIRPLA